ncbi:hypothetical protein ACFOEW_07585 [Alteromonas oceani]|uniref:Uncharacterized protein n=1 Tax=Alteromonas oceani TaxID=2071609 RepID=A0ABV7JY46_9ALTE|nr:hypothetical protein [Alteromonas oceani]
MNITDLFFPSGISVTRAKKDANKLKKAQNITLTEALNLVAQEHMSSPELTWDQAIEHLKYRDVFDDDNQDDDEQDEAEVSVEFSHIPSKQDFEEFLAVVEQDINSESFVSITPENDVYIESDGNGGKMWPSPLVVSESNAELICDMLNQMSLFDFELGLLDTEFEELIGSESYDLWQDSNYPQYDSYNSEKFEENEGDDQLYDSHFELKRRIEFAIQNL